MGGDISKEEAESRFFDDYALVRAEYDERFGEINIYKAKRSSEIVLVKEKVFENKHRFETFKKESEIRRKLDPNFVSQIHYFNTDVQDEWCTSFYKATIAFEFYEMTVDKLLRQMKIGHESSLTWFDQDEAWVLLKNLVGILRAYSMQGVTHGDIQPMNVFYIEDPHCDEKSLKVLDQTLLHEREAGYHRCNVDFDYHSPLSPSALAQIATATQNPDYDKSKNDVWAAGITMLATLFNEDFMKYYDWNRYTVRPEAIKKRLKILRNNGFSEKFVKILMKMLEVNDFQRIPINELYNVVEIGRRPGQNSGKTDQILRGSTPYSGISPKDDSFGQKQAPIENHSMRPTYDPYSQKSAQPSRQDIISMLSKGQNRGTSQIQNHNKTLNNLSTRPDSRGP